MVKTPFALSSRAYFDRRPSRAEEAGLSTRRFTDRPLTRCVRAEQKKWTEAVGSATEVDAGDDMERHDTISFAMNRCHQGAPCRI